MINSNMRSRMIRIGYWWVLLVIGRGVHRCRDQALQTVIGRETNGKLPGVGQRLGGARLLYSGSAISDYMLRSQCHVATIVAF